MRALWEKRKKKKKEKEELFTVFLRPVLTGRGRKNNFTVLKGH